MLWFKMDNEKINILKMLIENQEKEFSIMQISKKRKINYKSAYNVVLELEEKGIITIKRKGNISLCSFNRSFNTLVYIAEAKRRQELLKNKNFKVIYNMLNNINSQFVLLLFGSCVNGIQKKGSDIDFLLITDNAKEIEKQIKLIPLNIHLTDVSYDNFLTMLKSKELTVVSEALKKNIILFGIEDYYRLINNAK